MIYFAIAKEEVQSNSKELIVIISISLVVSLESLVALELLIILVR